MESQTLLKVEGISKSFPGVQALDDVSMEIHQGEILALVGENGAGKSTLIKILSGVYIPEGGRIYIQGEEQHFDNPRDAELAGISVVYQELSLVPNLSVAENIYNAWPPTNRLGLMNMSEMQRTTDEMLDRFEIQFNSSTRVGTLSLGNQQLVEIIKALASNAQILIFDEPTSSLSMQEANILFARLRRLKQRGITILFVSHHLEEVFEISDRVTVLRDGKYVGTKITSQTNEQEIVNMMVGRDLDESTSMLSDKESGPEILRVERLTGRGHFEEISFSVHSGEILTFFGLVGAGRTDVARTLVGLRDSSGGRVYIHGKEVKFNRPGTAMKKGIAYLPEDRKDEGLFLDKTIKENFLAPNLRKVAPTGWLRWGVLNTIVQEYVGRLEIRTPSLDQKVNNLSGGNQQKVLFGEWLATEPEVLIVDEPTRGIDVGTKAEIHRLLRNLAEQGKAVMVISSDLPETLRISDRIAVMRRGQLVGFIPGTEATEENIMELAAGATTNSNGKESEPK
jgi:ribose transport system ATP-binding protein